MAVDNVSENQARVLAQKRKAVEDEESSLETDRARASRNRVREGNRIKEQNDKELVAISKAGENQAEMVKKLNSDRVQSLTENHQKNFLDLSESTAKEISRLNTEALKAIDDHRAGTMEKVTSVTSASEDPFYRIKSLNPSLTEGEREFTVKVALAPHEASNLFVTGENQGVKLSLARRFQEQVKNGEQALTTKTSSYQTVVETLNLPDAINAKGIRREYADGIVTITVPKAGLVTEGLELPPLPPKAEKPV
jgi:HSP20 family molecular chaperone IbpA